MGHFSGAARTVEAGGRTSSRRLMSSTFGTSASLTSICAGWCQCDAIEKGYSTRAEALRTHPSICTARHESELGPLTAPLYPRSPLPVPRTLPPATTHPFLCGWSASL